MPSPNDPVLSCPLSYRVAPVFVQIVSHPLDWSPLSSFLVIWSPSGDTRGPSVVFEGVGIPCPEPFHLSHIVDYIYDFVLSLTQMLVFLSLYVMLSLLLSILVCTAASLFCACFGQCPGLCTICHVHINTLCYLLNVLKTTWCPKQPTRNAKNNL